MRLWYNGCMTTPFPGMDPWLERPGLWIEVHTGLISAIQRALTPLVRPRYRVAVERRVYLAVLPPQLLGVPDLSLIDSGDPRPVAVTAGRPAAVPLLVRLPQPEEVVERYLTIREVGTGEVVTVIELLSPTNKLPAVGREQYERKRLDILAGRANLVEIDLLRDGEPMPMQTPVRSDYRIVVSRAEYRPNADAWLVSVREPLPAVPVPLRPEDPEPLLPLNDVLHSLYDEAGYDLAIDYTAEPEPPLSPADAAWAGALLDRR